MYLLEVCYSLNFDLFIYKCLKNHYLLNYSQQKFKFENNKFIQDTHTMV